MSDDDPTPPLQSPFPDPTRTTTGVELAAVGHKLNWNTLITAIATVLVAVTGAFATCTGGGLKTRVDGLEKSVHEIREDQRDVYKAVMFGTRSERMEKPVDAGAVP